MRGFAMDAEVTSFIGLPVYTNRGRYVGTVSSVILDLPTRRVGSLLLTRTNNKIVDGSRDVAVPYRWVAAVGEIVLLSHFPDKVAAPGASTEEEEAVAA